MSLPRGPGPVHRDSVLVRFLGSADAANQARRGIERRHREDQRHYRQAAAPPSEADRPITRRDLDQLRDELAEVLAAMHGGDQ